MATKGGMSNVCQGITTYDQKSKKKHGWHGIVNEICNNTKEFR